MFIWILMITYNVPRDSCSAGGRESWSTISGVRQGTEPERVCTRHRGVTSSKVFDSFVSIVIRPSRTPLLVTLSKMNFIAFLLMAPRPPVTHVVRILINAQQNNGWLDSLVSAYHVPAVMVVYPPQPTSEEKALRKRYARLQELVSFSKYFVHDLQ